MAYKPNALTVPQGGTGQTSFSSGAIIIGNSTSALKSAVGTNNQIFAGQGASSDPIFTDTANIYLNSITINSGTSLNKYTEGTFNPTITSSGTPPTVSYNYQVGRYTRIGNRVIISVNVSLSSCSGGTGTAYIAGLPFSINFSASNTNTGSPVTKNFVLLANKYSVLNGVTNSTAFTIGNIASAASAQSYAANSFTSSTIISFSVIYEV